MKPKLGPVASLSVAVVFAIGCSAYTWFVLDTQHALATNGAISTGTVTAVHHATGRFSVDSIDVRIASYPDVVEVDHFSGEPKVGDELRVRYDRDDPTRMVQDGVSVWGPFEVVMVVMAVAGIVSTVIETRRWPKRRPRGRPFNPAPRPDGTAGGANQPKPWAAKPRRRKRRR